MTKWETEGGVPTKGLCYSKLLNNIRENQDLASMLAHLYADESPKMAQGWRAIAEMQGNMAILITQLATKGRLN